MSRERWAEARTRTSRGQRHTRLALSRALTGVSLTHMPAYRVSPPTRRFSSLRSEQHEDTVVGSVANQLPRCT